MVLPSYDTTCLVWIYEPNTQKLVMIKSRFKGRCWIQSTSMPCPGIMPISWSLRRASFLRNSVHINLLQFGMLKPHEDRKRYYWGWSFFWPITYNIFYIPVHIVKGQFYGGGFYVCFNHILPFASRFKFCNHSLKLKIVCKICRGEKECRAYPIYFPPPPSNYIMSLTFKLVWIVSCRLSC